VFFKSDVVVVVVIGARNNNFPGNNVFLSKFCAAIKFVDTFHHRKKRANSSKQQAKCV